MGGENLELRKAGLKVTVPRVKILQMLEGNQQRHLSAEDVYRNLLESGEDVGLATVYRVLTQFESAGLVTRHNFDSGHAVFELNRGDDHHDHMVCTGCGAIVEFRDDELEARQEAAARRHGFVIESHSLRLYGRCRQCAQARGSR